jgi:phosphotransferase system enzyme I (PtsI)
MSSDPRFALLLIGMGVRTLSMAPSAIGVIKRVVRSVSIKEAEEMAREVLSKTSPSDVERVMKRRLKMVLAKLRQLHASTDGIAQIADESLASPS